MTAQTHDGRRIDILSRVTTAREQVSLAHVTAIEDAPSDLHAACGPALAGVATALDRIMDMCRRDAGERGTPACILHDERAAVQRRIADAIRRCDNEIDSHDVNDVAALIRSGNTYSRGDVWLALAACAKCPEILYAVNQIAAMHAQERGG